MVIGQPVPLTPDEKQRRAEHARRLMDDPLVQEALHAMEKDAYERFATSMGATLTMTIAWNDLDAVRRFKQHFQEMLNDAMIAERR